MSWIGTGVSVAGGLMGAMGGSEDTAELKPWDAAAPFAEDIMGEAQGLYGQGAMNPLQMMGLQNQLGYWEQTAPGMIGNALSSWGQTLDPAAMNPYAQSLMDMTRQQMGDYFNESILPGITDSAITMGAMGGSRQGVAEGLAAERTSRALADQQNQLASQFYNQNLGQQRFGLSSLGSMLGAGAMPAQQQFGIGQTYQQAPWDNLSNYNNMITPYGSVGSVDQQPGMGQRVGSRLVSAGLDQALPALFDMFR